MSDSNPNSPSDKAAGTKSGADSGPKRSVGWLTMVAAGLVLLLAAGSLLWPRSESQDPDHTLLVFDSSGDSARVARVFEPLRRYLADAGSGDLELSVAATTADFQKHLAHGPDYVLAPDGLALTAPAEQYLPLVVGRRSAPRNLRPRGVLVYRLGAAGAQEPWLTHGERTVLGDTVSLVATGALLQGQVGLRGNVLAAGPDPYDHGPVLHALRLGGFDFALVRQWDAERFFEAGLLDESVFASRDLVGPAPDAVLLASRKVPRHLRLRCTEGLSGLGRDASAEEAPLAKELRQGLADMHLAGFNVLMEPDLEQVRKNYQED